MRRWVLLAYRLPREPSTPRIALWRSLRRLGAAQVVDGLVALPHTDEALEQFEWLAAAIGEASGDASVWLADATTRAEEDRWIERIRDASVEEYKRLRDRALEAATDDQATRRRALRLLRAELRRVRSRDYFDVPIGEVAEGLIERLALEPEEVIG